MTDPATGAPSVLGNVVVVLDETQDVVNIAGVMRAMMNMGLARLRLVRPAQFDAYRIEGIAHQSGPLIEATERFDDLDAALADVTWVVGTTARPRTAQRNFLYPRDGARQVIEHAWDGPVALLFGREDKGLSNQALDRCQQVVVIPTDPDYSSLNLAQACLVLCYEIHLAAGGGSAPLPTGRRESVPATQADLESMFTALTGGLERIDFFKSRRPEAVLRTLRTVFSRAGLDQRESKLLRAIGFEIGHYLDRMRR